MGVPYFKIGRRGDDGFLAGIRVRLPLVLKH